MHKLIDQLTSLMAIVGGLVLVGLVALTFYDVILRYLFSAPLRGRQDIVEMGMVLTLMLAAPYTWRVSGHIIPTAFNIDRYGPIFAFRLM